MARTEVAIVAVIGNAVAVVATALLPVAVLGLPIGRAMLLPVVPLFAFLAVLLLRGLHFYRLEMGLLPGAWLHTSLLLLLLLILSWLAAETCCCCCLSDLPAVSVAASAADLLLACC